MDGKALEMVVGDLSAPINEVGLQGLYDALKLRKISLLLRIYNSVFIPRFRSSDPDCSRPFNLPSEIQYG